MALPALIYLARLPHLASITIDRCVRQAEVLDLLAGAPALAGRSSGAQPPPPLLLSPFPSQQRLTLGLESAAVPLAAAAAPDAPAPPGRCTCTMSGRGPDLVLSAVGAAPAAAPPALAAAARARRCGRERHRLAGAAQPDGAARADGGAAAAASRLASGVCRRGTICCGCARRRWTTRCWRRCCGCRPAGLTVRALWGIGASCPRLERLELAGRYNVQELGAAGDVRLFPHRRTLRLTGAPIEVYDDSDDEQ